jgi:hypothetical protein
MRFLKALFSSICPFSFLEGGEVQSLLLYVKFYDQNFMKSIGLGLCRACSYGSQGGVCLPAVILVT